MFGSINQTKIIPRLNEPYVFIDFETFKHIITSPVEKILNHFLFKTCNSIYQIELMDRVINFSYNVDFYEVLDFKFDKKNQLVDLSNYKILEKETLRVAQILKSNPTSRKGLIVLSDNSNTPSCLINLQFLINNDELFLIANYRSQHQKYGYPDDVRMLRYLTTLFMQEVKKFDRIHISVNVADFHNYDIEQTQQSTV